VPYDLKKWVELYRQAKTPMPSPSETAGAAPAPAEPQGPRDPVDALPEELRQALPRTSLLAEAILPAGLFAGFGLLLAGGVVGTVRAARRAERR
jgi:hypothetical protein